jgi:hypothetical protein
MIVRLGDFIVKYDEVEWGEVSLRWLSNNYTKERKYG